MRWPFGLTDGLGCMEYDIRFTPSALWSEREARERERSVCISQGSGVVASLAPSTRDARFTGWISTLPAFTLRLPAASTISDPLKGRCSKITPSQMSALRTHFLSLETISEFKVRDRSLTERMMASALLQFYEFLFPNGQERFKFFAFWTHFLEDDLEARFCLLESISRDSWQKVTELLFPKLPTPRMICMEPASRGRCAVPSAELRVLRSFLLGVIAVRQRRKTTARGYLGGGFF
jgi:hypothetical protein